MTSSVVVTTVVLPVVEGKISVVDDGIELVVGETSIIVSQCLPA